MCRAFYMLFEICNFQKIEETEQNGTNRMAGYEGQITGCLIHRVTKYNGFPNACVRFSFPVLPFRKILSYFKYDSVRNFPLMSLAVA